MAEVYNEVQPNVVIDVVRSLGWLRQVQPVSRDNPFVRLYCVMGNGRPCVAWLMTYVIHVEAPCTDILGSIAQANEWNSIYGGPSVVYREDDGTMILRVGLDMGGGVTRECIRSHFLGLEYDLDHSLREL